MPPSSAIPFVVFVNSRFPCLSETFIFEQFQELQRQGLTFAITSNHRPTPEEIHPHMAAIQAQVHYLCDASKLEILAAHTHAFRRHPRRYLATLVAVLRSEEKLSISLKHLSGAALILKRFRHHPSLHLHAHFTYGAAAVVRWAKRLAGIPYTLTLHGSDLLYDNPPDLDAKLEEANALVSISAFNLTALTQRLPHCRIPTTVIPLGVAPLPPPPRPPYQGPLRLLNIGRLSEHKAQHILIAACRMLMEQGYPFHCRIVGAGPRYDELAGEIRRLGLANRVELTGPRFHDEVLKLYGEADVFVLSSIVEGMPLVLMEAMRAGVPVVATRVGAIPELVGDCGLLVPPHDPDSLSQAIIQLHQNPTLRERLAEKGRATVRERFDLTRNTARFRQFLLSLGATSAKKDRDRQE